MIERRRHPRIEVSHPVLYFPDISPRPRVATTVDLSMGGTKLVTPYGLISGEDLGISIAIYPQVIRCRGTVVHVFRSPNERLTAGVRFEEMSTQDRTYLGDYISSIMEQEALTP
ncbi:MAG: hypothetical protein GTN81_15200 [Proteobacteria bacterium]|nr:hypothetical protein [Pseudomonadota bacterium]